MLVQHRGGTSRAGLPPKWQAYARGMLISDLARQSGLPARTVRYYVDRRLLRPARRAPSGIRLFDDTALRQLRFIRRMQRFGLPLSEIARLLRASEELSCPPSSQLVLARLRRHVATVEARLVELEGVKHELTAMLADPDRDCGDDLCLCAEVPAARPRRPRPAGRDDPVA